MPSGTGEGERAARETQTSADSNIALSLGVGVSVGNGGVGGGGGSGRAVRLLEFGSLNAAVDEYFAARELSRQWTRVGEREAGARRKLENVRRDHERRLTALVAQQDAFQHKAAVVQAQARFVRCWLLIYSYYDYE